MPTSISTATPSSPTAIVLDARISDAEIIEMIDACAPVPQSDRAPEAIDTLDVRDALKELFVHEGRSERFGILLHRALMASLLENQSTDTYHTAVQATISNARAAEKALADEVLQSGEPTDDDLAAYTVSATDEQQALLDAALDAATRDEHVATIRAEILSECDAALNDEV